MRVLVTGSRDWNDEPLIRSLLTHYLVEAKGDRFVVVHGDCPEGADAMAQRWIDDIQAAAFLPGLLMPEAERRPADWRHFGKGAGMKRNAEMVAAGADVCLAFIRECSRDDCTRPEPHGSHGATDCAERAQRRGIKVRLFTEDKAGHSRGERKLAA